MGWRSWLGLAPDRDEFAASLARQAAKRGVPGWRFDPTEGTLTHPDSGQKLFVTNSWLEYSGAARAARSALMEKYLSLMLKSSGDEVPKLWGAAAKNLYACLRSRYQLMSHTIEARYRPGGGPRAPLSRAWHGDIDVVLMYDCGPYLFQVTAETADPWGETPDALFDRARANLAALPKPDWHELGDGVFQIVSEVSFEESFALVSDVWKSLPIPGDPVVAIPNRGVLLATGADTPAGLLRLIAEARRSMQEKPWPLSGLLLRRVADAWQPFVPDARVAPAARSLEIVSDALTYSEQQQALEKFFEHEGVDVYVGKFDLMRKGSDGDELQSWCSWTEGVDTLLPRTDTVILGRIDDAHKPIILPWADMARICGHYLQRTEDDPPRFRVNAFPAAEWSQLIGVGTTLG